MFKRIFILIVSFFYYVFKNVYQSAFYVFGIKPKNILVVLTYHNINLNQIKIFNQQMEEIIKYTYPVSVSNSHENNLMKNHVAVTFDDGFQNFHDYALPILLRHNIPTTIFIPTGYIGKSAGWISKNKINKNEMVMTRTQIKHLPPIITIGSHTVTHPYLNKLGENEIIQELRESKRTLEHILERPVELISLPYGSCPENIENISRREGYKKIFLNIPKHRSRNPEDIIFGRISISLQDWVCEYKLKILGGYQWLHSAIFIKNMIKKWSNTFLIYYHKCII